MEGDRFMGRLNWLHQTRLQRQDNLSTTFFLSKNYRVPFLPNFKAIGPHLIVQVEKMAPGFVMSF